jgi:glyoxylase-like metal-dependent hydrolase (beta-lactamase superfamily II)
MTSTSHRFHVGEIECLAVTDGTFSYPTNWIFSNVDRQQIESALRERGLSTEHVETPYTCLLITTGRRKILVDTGAGAFAPTTGFLIKNLRTEGISPEDITDVFLTHAHPDHIGGVLDGNGRPAFPNARYAISKTEWDFWTNPSALDRVSMDEHMKHILADCALKNLPPLKDRIDLLEGEKEIAPGVRSIFATGHTPGHMAVLIASSHDQLLIVSDGVLHPLHMENPGWRTVLDLDPVFAAKTRHELFDRAAADRISLLAYHFPFPGRGRVRSVGSSWKWEPEN